MPEKKDKPNSGSASRIKRYRELAEEAAARAERAATPELKRSYAQLAQGWKALAAQVERAKGLRNE